MNVAYPATEFESDLAAIEGFADLIKTGFENPEGLRASVKCKIPEHPGHGFVAVFGDTLILEPERSNREIDTVVNLPIATVHRIFREFEFLDWRDPEVIGTMTFEGNLAYANHLAKCCNRPSNNTLKRFEEVGRLHAERGYKDLVELERLHDPSHVDLLEVMAQSRPVIITGLEPTPPCRDWDLERLSKTYKEAIVRVRSATQKQSMADFVEELKEFQANPHDNIIEGFVKPYTEGAQMPDEMWDDFGPLFFSKEDFVPPQLWLGSVPTHIPTSSLHRDPLSGFLFQVIGRKRLDLYSADQEELLYPFKSYNNYQPCWFKPEAPDFEIFPKARHAKCLSVTLNPGELLVQPAGWFHQVYALDSPNMSVSYFWRYGNA